MKISFLSLFLASLSFVWAESTSTTPSTESLFDPAEGLEETERYVRITNLAGDSSWYVVSVRPAPLTMQECTSPLHMAAEAGDVETVQLLLEEGLDINSLNELGRNAWMIACMKGHYDLADILQQHGAKTNLLDKNGHSLAGYLAFMNDVEGLEYLQRHKLPLDEKDEKGFTPLLRACQHAAVESMEFLIASGADVQTRNEFNQTVLIQCAMSGCAEMLGRFIALGVPEDVLDSTGRTAYMQACFYAQPAAMKFFLDRGADPNARSAMSVRLPMLTLCLVCERTRAKEAATLLLDAGADIEARTEGGESALMYACWNNNVAAVELLLDRGARMHDAEMRRNPINTMVSGSSMDVLRLFLKRGFDVNSRSEHLSTVLHYAARFGDVEMTNLLLDEGADIEARDKQGFTPLVCAASASNKAVLRLLIQRGAQLNALTETERPALDYAILKGDFESCKLLVESGADLNGLNKMGFTPLQLACKLGRPDVIRLLLDHGALVNLKDIMGKTALDYAKGKQDRETVILLEHMAKLQGGKLPRRVGITPEERPHFIRALCYACCLGNASRVEQLIASGISVNAQQGEDETTPLIASCRAARLDMVELLLKHHADLELSDKAGNTPLLAAVSSDNHELAQLLLSKGAKKEARNALGQGLWHLAALGGDVAMLRDLVQQGADVHAVDALGQSALFLACEGRNNTGSLAFLLEAGCKIDHQSHTGQTALMKAAFTQNTAKLYQLLEAGADPSLCDEQGQDALIISQRSDFRLTYEESSQLRYPISRLDICTLLLDFGADAQLKDKQGKSALDYSREHKHPRCESLIASFAQGSSLAEMMNQDELNKALGKAISHGHPELAKLYINHGANVNTLYSDTRDTPLFKAIAKGDLALYHLLLEMGADPQHRLENQMSTLIMAAGRLQHQMVEDLLARGLDINAQTNDGRNALLAAYRCSEDAQGRPVSDEQRIACLKLLLKLGADPDKPAKDGKSFRQIITEQQSPRNILQELSL